MVDQDHENKCLVTPRKRILGTGLFVSIVVGVILAPFGWNGDGLPGKIAGDGFPGMFLGLGFGLLFGMAWILFFAIICWITHLAKGSKAIAVLYIIFWLAVFLGTICWHYLTLQWAAFIGMMILYILLIVFQWGFLSREQ